MVLKSAILYKNINNPLGKIRLSDIQFMRQNMNMNKNFFHNFLECFHWQLYAVQT